MFQQATASLGGVLDLGERQTFCGPVGALAGLVELDVEIGPRRICEAGLRLAEGQATRLHRAVHLRRGDAVVFEEREFEGRIVGDQHHVVQAL